jgi:hypothetical protein
VCAMVREKLMRLDIDPASARALRVGDAAPAELAGMGDGPEAPPEDAFALGKRNSDEDFAHGEFAAKILGMAQRYQDGHEPDPARASLAELFAWCLASRADSRPSV